MKETKHKSKSNLIFIWMLAIVSLLWFTNMYLVVFENKKDSDFDKGTFGDMFGAVNALFSGLAFAGLIYTAMMQREELKLQREELGLTREEFKRMVATQELSEQALKKQAQAYIYSAIISGHNSRVAQLNKDIDELTKESFITTNLSFDNYNIKEDIKKRQKELKAQLKFVEDFLRKLHELES